MNNPETLATSNTQDTGQNKHQNKQKGQSIMNNTETLSTSYTPDVVLFVCLCPVSGVPNVDSIPVLSFCLFVTKTQHRDTVNIGYTRHSTETNKQKHNTEMLSTLGTPDTGQRQTNKKHNT
jgi:hypothetical protein